MSHIANAVDHLLRESNKSAAEIAKVTNLNAAQISRWRTGEQKSIKPQCLRQLAAGFPGPIALNHAALLFAHLNDECAGPGAHLISIQLLASPVAEPKINPVQPKLPPTIQSDIEVILKNVTSNRHVRDLVHSIAELCRANPLR